MPPFKQGTGTARPDQFSRVLPALLSIVAVFFLTFISRMVFGPLMVVIEGDLGISHAQAGGLFLFMSLGLSAGLLSAGVLSAYITHKRVVVLSALLIGLGLLLAGGTQGLWGLRAALMAVGYGAGLYLPSGLAMITALVEPRNWGKALSLHEAAPNTSYILAPLLAEMMVAQASWRAGVTVLGACCLAVGLAFLAWFDRGRFTGEVLNPDLARRIVRVPAFWLLTLSMGLAVGASIGPYAMLPLHLTDLGWSRPEANHLLAVSRISGVLMAFVSGWLTDRLGVRWTMGGYFLLCGLFTALLGLTTGSWLVVVALLQPAVSVCYFPAGFTAVSRVFEPRVRGAAVALMTPFTAFFGAGLVPAALGAFGEAGAFGTGFVVQGCLLLTLLAILPLLRIEARKA